MVMDTWPTETESAKRARLQRYMSGQEAIDKGIITEGQWQQAIAHPWVWVVISSALRIREIPWNGLELDLTACDNK